MTVSYRAEDARSNSRILVSLNLCSGRVEIQICVKYRVDILSDTGNASPRHSKTPANRKKLQDLLPLAFLEYPPANSRE